jgi:hypothetical protein
MVPQPLPREMVRFCVGSRKNHCATEILRITPPRCQVESGASAGNTMVGSGGDNAVDPMVEQLMGMGFAKGARGHHHTSHRHPHCVTALASVQNGTCVVTLTVHSGTALASVQNGTCQGLLCVEKAAVLTLVCVAAQCNKALSVTNGRGVEAAMEWILANPDDDGSTPAAPPSGGGGGGGGAVPAGGSGIPDAATLPSIKTAKVSVKSPDLGVLMLGTLMVW